MAQKIIISKPGFDALTETTPNRLIFSSDYNTLKYSLANGSASININTSNEGVYRTEISIPHNLGYKPFFKVYVISSFASGAYLPTGFFYIVDLYANAFFTAEVDNNNIYLIATGKNSDIVTTTFIPGSSGLSESFNAFFNVYNGAYPVGNTPGNTGQCTGLVNVWCDDWLGLSHIWGDAKDMMAWARTHADNINDYDVIDNTPTNVPQVGDMVCWNGNVGGGAGHTAIATGNGNVNEFETFDQNWSPTYCHKVTHNYSNVMGWIRPRNQQGGGGSYVTTREPHNLQYLVTFKYKIFKNSLGL